MGAFEQFCLHCGTQPEQAFCPFCPHCGGMIEIRYLRPRLRPSSNPFERFFDLLPVHDPALLPADAGYTPLVHARGLGGLLGLPRLYLKNETVLPTGTTKYRQAAVVLAHLYESGVRHFCTSSTGNSSTALAHTIGRLPELKMSLFTSEAFRPRVNYRSSPQIDHYIVLDGSFVDAGNCAADFAARHGLTGDKGFFNPARREGLKFVMLEAADQLDRPIDWYVQAVSSAMGVYATYKAAKELQSLGRLSKLPSLLCVQQESCAPMVRAWQEQAEAIQPAHIVPRPEGIAYAILRGDPSKAYPYMREVVSQSGGDFAAVSEPEIRRARQLVSELEGIEICFAAAAAVAGLIQAARSGRIPPEATILLNLSGSDRQGPVPEEVGLIAKTDTGWQLLKPMPPIGPVRTS